MRKPLADKVKETIHRSFPTLSHVGGLAKARTS